MATILTKRSNTAASVPLAAQLTNSSLGAELAVNTTDKRLFTKDGSGNVVELGINPSSLTLPNGTANGVPYLNGSKVLTSGSALVFDGTNLGVGAASPAFKLDVNGTAAAGNLRLPSAGNASVYWGSGGTQIFGNNESGTEAINFYVAGSTRATVNAAGNLGLGVTPSAWDTVNKAFQISYGSSSGNTDSYAISHNAYYNADWKYVASSKQASQYDQYQGTHRFFTAPSGTAGNAISFTQAMTLDASGNLLVGKTSASDTSVGGHILSTGRIVSTMSSSTSGESTLHVYSTGAGAYRFYVNMAGNVYATSTTITAISDQRLKENIQDIDAGLPQIMALKPRKFDWKAGKGKDIKGDRGWIAQEFEQVFPDMIDTWKDEAPEGEEPYKSVRADLIPVLVKAIQEQQALITSLTARIAALEAAA